MTPLVCHAVPRAARRRPAPPAVESLVGLLRQLFELVGALSNEAYTATRLGWSRAASAGTSGTTSTTSPPCSAACGRAKSTTTTATAGPTWKRDRLAAMAEILRLERELTDFPWTRRRRRPC